MKKLPFILAFAVTIFAASCSDDMAIEPVHTDNETTLPPPPPPSPSGSSVGSSDTTTVILG